MRILGMLCFSVAFLYCIEVSGQSAAADLHFESAEKAYNEGDYLETLRKLDDTERIAGTMSKTLYLRIVAQDRVLDNWLVSDSNERKSLLDNLKENVRTYLEVMESQGLDDRYREVFALSEKYKDYTEPDYSIRYAQLEEEKKKNYFLTNYEYQDEARFKELYPTGVLKKLFIEHKSVYIFYDDVDKVIWRWVHINEDDVYFFEYPKECATFGTEEAYEAWTTFMEIYLNPKKMSKKEKSFMDNLDFSFLYALGRDADGSFVDGVRMVTTYNNGITNENLRHRGEAHVKQHILAPNGSILEFVAFVGIPFVELTEKGKTIGIFALDEHGKLTAQEQKRWDAIMTRYQD